MSQEQKEVEQLQKGQESVLNKVDVFGPLKQKVTMLQKQAAQKCANTTKKERGERSAPLINCQSERCIWLLSFHFTRHFYHCPRNLWSIKENNHIHKIYFHQVDTTKAFISYFLIPNKLSQIKLTYFQVITWS